jgi:hypothetical protein
VDDPFALRFVGPFATEYEALMYAAYVDEIVLTQSAEIDGLEVTIKGLESPCGDYRSA